ncbi:hypothetical protein TW65_00657 [Stemphylium lycopersici]|nr:hypothetical protein TW65_00657 [Stemphylium lycopersici]
MASPPKIPKSALDKYLPVKLISDTAGSRVIAVIPRAKGTPIALSFLLALKIPALNTDRATLLNQIKTAQQIGTRSITKVVDHDPNGNWYVTLFHSGQTIEHIKQSLSPGGLPPFLVFKIFVEMVTAQDTYLGPRGMCHTDLGRTNIILSPTTTEELPYVRLLHIESIASWDDEAVWKQAILLLRYLTGGVERIPYRFRTNKKGNKLEHVRDSSLNDADDLYSFAARYDIEGGGSWKEIKSKFVNMARALMLELLDRGRLADVKECIGERMITLMELDAVVEEGGMEVVIEEDT